MKRILFFMPLALLMVSCGYEVRTVRSHPRVSSPGGVVYALPRTLVYVDVAVGHYDTTAAPFARYAEEMLATYGRRVGYEVRSVSVGTELVADQKNRYYVRPRGITLQVDRRGLLQSVGLASSDLVEVQEHQQARAEEGQQVDEQPLRPQYNLYDRTDTFYTRRDRPGHPSMVASRKDVRSLRQQAVAAAERLGQLQERRQQLLAGETEESFTPEGLKTMLQLVGRQEQQILEQFMGRYVTETLRFTIDPSDARGDIDSQSVVLFNFDKRRGVVDTGSVGMPVVCTLRADNSMRQAAKAVRVRGGLFRSRNMNDRNTIKYRAPEVTEVTVGCELFTFHREVSVAQFGPIMELPRGRVKALFDIHTGELMYLGN